MMLILDEFHRLGKMPIVADSITTLRSFGGHLAVITQTIPKLDEIYGRNERLSLEGGAGIKLYMTPSEELTVENLSAACGSTTKRVVSKSKGIGPFATPTVSERSEERPLLTEDDARRLPLDDVILVVDGGMPIRAKRIKYYADRTLGPIFRAQSGDLPEPEPHLPLTKSEDAAPAMVKDTEKASPQPDLMKSLEEISAKITALETKVAAAGSAQDASPDASNDAANRLERPYSELLAALELAETKIAVLENKVNQAIHDTATTSSEVAAETSPDLPGSGLQKRRKNRGLYVENTRATSIVNSMASSTG